jgi:hypothetical protein
MRGTQWSKLELVEHVRKEDEKTEPEKAGKRQRIVMKISVGYHASHE